MLLHIGFSIMCVCSRLIFVSVNVPHNFLVHSAKYLNLFTVTMECNILYVGTSCELL